MKHAEHRYTITFVDRGEHVCVELPMATYESYQKQADHMRVPIETVLRRSLRPVVSHIRRARRQKAP